MFFVAPPPNAEAAEVYLLYGLDQPPDAEGVVGKAISKQLYQLAGEFNERLLGHSVVDDIGELNSYQHVPLKAVGTIEVRFTRIEPLLPRRLDTDDD